VDLLPLRNSVVLEQRLCVLPAGKTPDLDFTVVSTKVDLDHVAQVSARAVAKDGALHVRGLEFASVGEHVALRRDDGLGDVDAVGGGLLGEAQDHGDGVLFCCGFEEVHFRGADGEGVVDVAGLHFDVDRAGPGMGGQDECWGDEGGGRLTISRRDSRGSSILRRRRAWRRCQRRP